MEGNIRHNDIHMSNKKTYKQPVNTVYIVNSTKSYMFQLHY
jgi:hypothetical protein